MFSLTSGAFDEGAAIPVRYSCNGADVSPPLAWTGAPEGTAAFALILDDPDARNFVHWVVANLPASESSLAEGASGALPDGTVEGRAGFGRNGYGGPCPPGGTHRYVFRLFALSAAAPVEAGVSAAELRIAIEGLVLGEAVLTGTFTSSR